MLNVLDELLLLLNALLQLGKLQFPTSRLNYFYIKNFMNYQVYVLHSTTYSKIYIGYTSNLNQRIKSHNFLAKKGYTVKYRPWSLIYHESFEEKKQAIKRERALKTARGRKFIWDLIKSNN